jgi:hypothetical protein
MKQSRITLILHDATAILKMTSKDMTDDWKGYVAENHTSNRKRIFSILKITGIIIAVFVFSYLQTSIGIF